VILDEALLVITVVVSVLAIFLTDGAALVAAGIVVGALVGQYVISDIQNSHENDAPSIADLKNNFTAPIVWTGSDHLTLQSAKMATSLQLGGIWKG